MVREKAETRNVQDEGAESDRHYSLPAAVWHWVELPRSVATPLLIGIDGMSCHVWGLRPGVCTLLCL